MSERRERSTRHLSRETVQLMLEMKSLLRKYDITISLTAPDVQDLLIQAAEAIDDEEIRLLRHRLMVAKSPTQEPSTTRHAADEADPFADDDEKKDAKPIFTVPSVASNGSNAPIRNPLSLDASKPEDKSVRNVYIQGAFVENEADVFLESVETQGPTTKRVALNTPRTGLLRCDQCQRTSTVKAAASVDEAVEVTCPCGMVYRVLMDSRKYDRKLTSLPGFYVHQKDDTKTGTIVVENISFGGLRFRTTSSQELAYGDLLNIQFTLDNEVKTLVWENVRVHYVKSDLVGVEFVNPNEFSRDLAAYLMR